MRRFGFLLPTLLLFTTSSCEKREEIKTYRVAKGPSQTPSQIALQTVPTQSTKTKDSGIAWKVPAAWTELPASGMRVASFLVRGLDAESVDVSITHLEGEGGGPLANVNRWREQLNLVPWSASEFEKNLILIETPLGPAIGVDFSNGAKRVIAALLPYEQKTWFFKMTGRPKLLDEQKESFIILLSSIH